jgi:hypothetical protein
VVLFVILFLDSNFEPEQRQHARPYFICVCRSLRGKLATARFAVLDHSTIFLEDEFSLSSPGLLVWML